MAILVWMVGLVVLWALTRLVFALHVVETEPKPEVQPGELFMIFEPHRDRSWDKETFVFVLQMFLLVLRNAWMTVGLLFALLWEIGS